MRSAKTFAGSVILLAGVPAALAAGVLLDAWASEVIHLALGLGFALFAWGAGDFRVPRWLVLVCRAGIGVLALVFLLQLLADLTRSPDLTRLAYSELGQGLEKALGYVFLGWCLAILAWDSWGRSQWLGVVVAAVILAVEVYGLAAVQFGMAAPGGLKLFYLPVVIWLLLESLKTGD